MKKFVAKIAFWLVFCIVITGVFPYIVDPYNVFHIENIRTNGVEPNKNYIKMSYVINNPEKFDAFLFGSSRVGSIHTENIPGVNCYNMTYSAGLPVEHLNNIQTLVDSGIKINHVYVGLDSLGITDNLRNHDGDAMRMSYEYCIANPDIFLKTYYDPLMTLRSLKTIVTNEGGFDVEAFYEHGWWAEYDRETGGAWTENIEPYIGTSDNVEANIVEVIENVRDIKSLCEANGIQVTFFTNPMQEVTQKASVEMGYLDFLEALSTVTDYYNFSGINDITTDNMNYIDNSHYSAQVGDLMIDAMCNGNVDEELRMQGFGVLVTRDNVQEIIEIIQ